MEPESPASNSHVVRVGIAVEAGLILLALGLSLLGLYDQAQPLSELSFERLAEGFKLGLLASLPLLSYLLFLHFYPIGWFRSLRQFCVEHLKPLFAGATILELAILSTMAGLGEELLFRWSIQGGITSLVQPRFEQTTAIWLGLMVASFLFGLCHAMSWLYFMLTFIGGLFLGWTMVVSGNWLVPATAHAVYDFVALIYITKLRDGFSES